jgi:CHAD domain-containing protein
MNQHHTQPQAIQAVQPTGQFLASIIGQELERFHQFEPMARANENIEGVHKLRIGVRRLRAIITAFSSAIVTNTSSLLDELRVLGGVLGALRDLDVLRLKIPEWSFNAALEPQVQVIVQSALKGSSLTAYRKLLNTLDAPRTQNLFKRLNALAQTRLVQFEPDDDRQKIEHALQTMYKHLQYLDAQARKPHASLESLHALRKQAKRVRYVIEMLEPILGSKVGKTIKQVKALQSQLGEINDLAFALEYLHQMARGQIDLAFVLEPLEGYLETRLKTSRAQFLSESKTFDPRVEWQTLRRGFKHLEHAK